ncbi:MAG: hypothetical protein ACI87W_001895 [Halieaceae bacterium]
MNSYTLAQILCSTRITNSDNEVTKDLNVMRGDLIVLHDTLQPISVGAAQQSGPLTMFPLLSSVETIADYVLR